MTKIEKTAKAEEPEAAISAFRRVRTTWRRLSSPAPETANPNPSLFSRAEEQAILGYEPGLAPFFKAEDKEKERILFGERLVGRWLHYSSQLREGRFLKPPLQDKLLGEIRRVYDGVILRQKAFRDQLILQTEGALVSPFSLSADRIEALGLEESPVLDVLNEMHSVGLLKENKELAPKWLTEPLKLAQRLQEEKALQDRQGKPFNEEYVRVLDSLTLGLGRYRKEMNALASEIETHAALKDIVIVSRDGKETKARFSLKDYRELLKEKAAFYRQIWLPFLLSNTQEEQAKAIRPLLNPKAMAKKIRELDPNHYKSPFKETVEKVQKLLIAIEMDLPRGAGGEGPSASALPAAAASPTAASSVPSGRKKGEAPSPGRALYGRGRPKAGPQSKQPRKGSRS
jgi:hypothetical protein